MPRAIARAPFIVTATLATLATFAGCLTVPATTQDPTTKTNFTTTLRHQQVDKVDLLFAIDSSSSMGDKQALLREAIPDLLMRLLVPNCVDATDENRVVGQSQNGKCASGRLEFQPIKDLHVGIVSSDLGTPGSNTCTSNDKAHLLTRSASGSPVADATASSFLSWFPTTNDENAGPKPVDAISDPDRLVESFQEMVRGVREVGCGFEAQEESWYRFLVQPDPYKSIAIKDGKASLVGVDEEILRQRAEFLRPDSLVAVILVTDENESTVDPLAEGGTGWKFADRTQGTDDQLNVRFFNMKERFGVDPQFPISRYVNGLGVDPKSGLTQRSPKVPNRDGEHPDGAPHYVGKNNCTNPLFAAKLPTSAKEELCKLEPGIRVPELVFFAAITGVPHQLLHFDPKDAKNSRLASADWRKILGTNPLDNDANGIDPHMIESIKPRAALAGVKNDPIHVREWNTLNDDLQFACTFDLSQPRRCTTATPCDCKDPTDAPLCDNADSSLQVRAKAYPGVRHLEVVKTLGDQGVVSSICPIDTRDASLTNPLYGYRPAVKVIVDRLKNALAVQCLPRPLAVDDEGKAPCLVLEMLGKPGDQSQCDQLELGRRRPDPKVLQRFIDDQKQQHGDDGFDPAAYPICEINELTVPNSGSCNESAEAGWCYTAGAPARTATGDHCSDAILFSPKGNPKSGSRVFLQCIEKL